MNDILNNINTDPKIRDCEYVLNDWKRVNKIRLPNEICILIDLFFYAQDEWIAFGDNLEIKPNDNNSTIQNTGNHLENDGYLNKYCNGSGYGLKVVESDHVHNNQYYWKILVDDMYGYSFAIGFVRELDGIIDFNTWYIKNKYSLGIYSNNEIWTQGTVLKNKGIKMAKNDIINLCLSYKNDYKGVYAQRLEYIHNDNKININNMRITSKELNKYWKIHKAIRVFKGIDLNSNYRLACYLRTKLQKITIIKFSCQPFDEWKFNKLIDQTDISDEPIIVQYV